MVVPYIGLDFTATAVVLVNLPESGLFGDSKMTRVYGLSLFVSSLVYSERVFPSSQKPTFDFI